MAATRGGLGGAHLFATTISAHWFPVSAGSLVSFAERLEWGYWGGLKKIELLAYVGSLGIGKTLGSLRALREKEVGEARLQAQLNRAQLEALGARLQPHFLFNALNGIAVLIEEDPALASRMILRLSDLLRGILERDGEDEVTLGAEIELLTRYLALEEMRFPDRLRVEWRIDEDCKALLVPNLLFQPLVENAVRHGIARRAESGCIALEAHRENGRLHIAVEDDGAGLPKHWREGIGLSNTRERLAQLYPNTHEFRITARDPRGVRVDIALPARAERSQTD